MMPDWLVPVLTLVLGTSGLGAMAGALVTFRVQSRTAGATELDADTRQTAELRAWYDAILKKQDVQIGALETKLDALALKHDAEMADLTTRHAIEQQVAIQRHAECMALTNFLISLLRPGPSE
jgi:hypothetical protein